MPRLPASVLRRRRKARAEREAASASKTPSQGARLAFKGPEVPPAKPKSPAPETPASASTPPSQGARLAFKGPEVPPAESKSKSKPVPRAQREDVSPRTESLGVTPEESRARTGERQAAMRDLQSTRSMIAEPETPPSPPKKRPRVTGKGGRNVGKKANVTKEQLEATGVSLREYLNKYDELGRRPTKADFGPAKKMRGGGMLKPKGYRAGGKVGAKGYKAKSKVRGAGCAIKGVRPAKMR
tara:strand:+ start:4168 stop:4890 length:723 start_codon:yes stop_codon:yes gene_type:complete